MGPQLEALAEHDPKVKLRVIDIGSWDSPVARQFGIRLLPTVWLYEDGALYSKDRDRVLAKLNSRR